ncbi:MAG: chorismate synthase [Planctomycetaceae bacterium]|jgi:chorismate synthase|nr:chorismate synthase [Planctomycetaceae bacterium]
MRFFTAGESHGRGLLALLDGFPAGIVVDTSVIDSDLRRRQGGYGRGARQKIETDTVELLTGICRGITTGAPITLWVKNKDYRIDEMPLLNRPRPGHADLAGAITFGQGIRPVLERSSARETAARVAAGGLCRQLLTLHSIRVVGYVLSIGNVDLRPDNIGQLTFDELLSRRDNSELYSAAPERDAAAKNAIDKCKEDGDSLGGVIEVRIDGVPFGLGSCMQWDKRLDGLLAQAVMSVQAIKGVEIGLGFESANQRGSKVHDPIIFDTALENTAHRGFVRSTNNAGGIEGGMSNSEPIIIRAAMKPIPTMTTPLPSVDLTTHQPTKAEYERSDVCAVSAASVVVEAAAIIALATALVESLP